MLPMRPGLVGVWTKNGQYLGQAPSRWAPLFASEAFECMPDTSRRVPAWGFYFVIPDGFVRFRPALCTVTSGC